jgi:Inositol monophosphatase family
MTHPHNLPEAPDAIVARLLTLQRQIRSALIAARARGGPSGGLAEVSRTTEADTIYSIDAEIEPIIEHFVADWATAYPIRLVAEGLEDAAGNETAITFPRGTPDSAARITVIMDPIDGTRGIMYDKRPAWALAAVAVNHSGRTPTLADCVISVMTELPTSKMGWADVLWAVKGAGAHGRRACLADDTTTPLHLAPSRSPTLAHGFASVANFFPSTKSQAAALAEAIATAELGEIATTRAGLFDDQYICTGGQYYELIVGHDRFIADLRPVFYQQAGKPPGLCCHPYDCAALLVAQEAGVIITDAHGQTLDTPLDTTSPVSWIGYANATIRARVEPVIQKFLTRHA